jgi:hypothetical protein
MKPDSQDRDQTPVTRTEAIHQAIVALGPSAPVAEILEYVWEHFGIGVPPAGSTPPASAAQAGERPGLEQERAAGPAAVALVEPPAEAGLEASPPADDLPLESPPESPGDPSAMKKSRDRRSRQRE